MHIPFSLQSETPEQKHKRHFTNRLNKAKHLRERMKLFVDDLNKSNLKASEKDVIITELFK